MKKLVIHLSVIGFIVSMTVATASAQVYSSNIVGYVNTVLQSGYNWIGNPLDNPPNQLSALVPTAPDGTTVSLWNSTLNLFTPTVTFNTGFGWSSDLTLNPGTGFQLDTTSPFTNTFVGNVLDFNGSGWGGGVMPSPFAGPSGLYLLSSKAPVALSGDVFNPGLSQFSVFLSIIGRNPLAGESVTTLDPLTQTYFTTTWNGSAWDNGAPTLAVGQAAMFNIGPVPEPSTLGLLALGLGVLGVIRRRRRS
jgi:hypothetical protein